VSRPDPARLLVQLETLAGLMAGRDGVEAGLPGPAAWYEATTGRRLDEWQRAILESDANRQLLVCGRQCGKTEVVSAGPPIAPCFWAAGWAYYRQRIAKVCWCSEGPGGCCWRRTPR
jgi:hypothetical protein